MVGLIGAIKGKRNADVPMRTLVNHLVIALLPALAVALLMGSIYLAVTAPDYVVPSELQEMGFAAEDEEANAETGDLEDPEEAGGLQEPPAETEPGGAGRGREPEGARRGEAGHATRGRGRAGRAQARPHRLLGHARHRRGGARGFLCDLHLRAARDLQDAADLLLPAGAPDPRGARLHRRRPGDADRGGGDGVVRGVRAGGRLPAAST